LEESGGKNKMDNSLKKWFVRAGSFLILFGFFIPSMAVSCTVMGMTQEQPFSMSTAASSQYGNGILYLVLLGAFIAIVFSFLPPQHKQQKTYFIIGEGVGLGLGVLSILIASISLSGQFRQLGLGFTVKPGFFVLLLGYGLAGFGTIMDFFEPTVGSYLPQNNYRPSPEPLPFPPAPTYEPPPPPFPGSGPRLELIKGNAPPVVVISNSDFHVGRSSQNHLSVNDIQVSRVHIRIRGAQGQWFIQDQNSSSGTFVNGSRIQAQPLKDGDNIRVGETIFKFRM
jgi:hypothetical protein